VGEPIFASDVPFEAGSFTVDLLGATVPADGNPITYQDLVADITLDGAVLTLDDFCGAVSGNLIVPFELPLDGSTFGAVRTDDVTAEDVVSACP
jgi:hypothetical protein